MNKAYLIMDMPSQCDECFFEKESLDDEKFCYLNWKKVPLKGRPNWCELHSVPKFKNPNFEDYTFPREREKIIKYIQGWNDCLKTITENVLKKEEK